MVLYVYLPCIDSGVNLLEERYPKYTYSDVENWVPVRWVFFLRGKVLYVAVTSGKKFSSR